METAGFWVVPAIDLLEGRVVRLQGGDFGRVSVYAQNPVAWACELVRQGAPRLHLVDLSGAREGRPVHLEVLRAVAGAAGVPVQYGGGLRTPESVAAALEAGAWAVLLGTLALQAEVMARLLERFGPKRIWAAIDVRDGRVAVAGWRSVQEVTAGELAARLAGLGVRRAVVTDTARDGLMAGPNLEAAHLAAGQGLEVLVAGGISGRADVEAVARAAAFPEGAAQRTRGGGAPAQAAGSGRIVGVVIGRALYEGRLSLAEALAAARSGGGAPCWPAG